MNTYWTEATYLIIQTSFCRKMMLKCEYCEAFEGAFICHPCIALNYIVLNSPTKLSI